LSKDKTKNVFLNIPYVQEFLPFEVVYWTTLEFFGLTPVFSSDFRPTGQRIEKINAMLSKCAYGISDLSVEVRLGNIASEMGYMIARGVICQPCIDQRYRDRGGTRVVKFDELISDWKGLEPIIYDGDRETLIKKLATWVQSNPGIRARRGSRHASSTILKVCDLVERIIRQESTPERAERYSRIKPAFSKIVKQVAAKLVRGKGVNFDIFIGPRKVTIKPKP
jgi:hypothetical protein